MMETIEILWVEDADDWFDATQGYIRAEARILQVEISVDRHKNGDGIDAAIEKGNVHIALVDHKLRHNAAGDTTTGGIITKKLLEGKIAKSVIYYSEHPQGMDRNIATEGTMRYGTRKDLADLCLECIEAIIAEIRKQ